jgi:hypothetical protein
MDRRKLELEVEVRLAGQQRPRAVIQCVLRVRHVSLFSVCVCGTTGTMRWYIVPT